MQMTDVMEFERGLRKTSDLYILKQAFTQFILWEKKQFRQNSLPAKDN